MTGYLGDSESTKDAMVKGWLKTGDVGCCRGGKWYITDRVKVGSILSQKPRSSVALFVYPPPNNIVQCRTLSKFEAGKWLRSR